MSSRALLSGYLTQLGIAADIHAPLMTLIDKKEKVDAGWLKEEMGTLGVTADQIESIFNLLDLHDLAAIEHITGPSEDVQQLKDLMRYAEALGYADYIQIDPSIIRGLAYYTGIVFEAFDNKRQFRALFGGGRYDNLFTRMTGKDIPACGMGFGDGVIRELYEAKFGEATGFASVPFYIGYFDASLQEPAMALIRQLNALGFDGDLALSPQNPKKFFTAANKRRAQVAVYVAPEEYARGEVVFKNMETGTQTVLSWNTLTAEQVLAIL